MKFKIHKIYCGYKVIKLYQICYTIIENENDRSNFMFLLLDHDRNLKNLNYEI